jgi:hypothetical protein
MSKTTSIPLKIMVDLTTTRARARDIAVAINHEGTHHPAFARDSRNVAVVAALQNTSPTPSTNRVDKVYHQLKDILNIAIV